MAKARTYVRPDAAREAAKSAGIPETEIALVQNEHTGRWSYLRLPSGAQAGTAVSPPPAPRLPATAVPSVRRAPRAISARTEPVESRYAPHRTLVVLNQDILERIEVARRRVKPGERVPNRSEIIRGILNSKLPQASAANR